MSQDSFPLPAFTGLELAAPVLKALDDVGYETPTPIQAEMIPHVLAGKDVLGQAQTGTGKTAAFALPILSRIDIGRREPQVLVLTPTRELAIQVAEAFQRYASHLKGFHVVPIYGGQDYSGQIRQLKRGVHVVVGTPGRVMDHMRRGTLNLKGLDTLVLDEADEMLRMGFIDDVEWVLEQTPPNRQVALFSATLPEAIGRIARRHLSDPVEIRIKVRTATAETIRQRYWMVSGLHKLDALTRMLEAETFDGIIVFVRTKIATAELAQKLEARGYAAAPLNGDIPQKLREQTIGRLKAGRLDILVATDVAARGLDVERISHVINYDVPYDTEAYIHRIGRTGRAGRSGEAILFVAPREKRMLYAIEKATRQKIEMMELPSTELLNDQRIARFKQRITDTLGAEELELYYQMMEQYQQEHNVPALEVAAALAKMVQGNEPLLLQPVPERKKRSFKERSGREVDSSKGKPAAREERGFSKGKPAAREERDFSKGKPAAREERGFSKERIASGPEPEMERFRIEVGHSHGVKPGNIVGAIANEAGLESRYIGRIDIQDDYSTVDLPEGMPKDIFRTLKKVWVSGQQLRISKFGEAKGARPPKKAHKSEKPQGRRKTTKTG